MNNLVTIKDDPVKFLKSSEMQATLDALRGELTSVIYDASDDTDREIMLSSCKTVSKTRTLIEKQSLNHARVIKQEAKDFDAQRKVCKDFLLKLEADVIKPITDLEEKERVIILAISNRINQMDCTPAALAITGKSINSLAEMNDFHARVYLVKIKGNFGDQEERAKSVKETSLLILKGMIAEKEKEVMEV